MPFIRSLHLSIVNPLQPPRCPRCFKPVHPGLCQVVTIDDENRVLTQAPRGLMRLVKTAFVPQVWGDDFLLARRQCYNCQGLLPDHVECMDHQLIGLVGGSVSGKSHYIASLIKQLQYDGVLKHLGLADIQVDSMHQKRYNEEYYVPLYEEHRPLDPTKVRGTVGEERLVDPLVFTLVFGDNQSDSARKVTLVLFDAAGEDMDTQEDIVRWTPYILNASALIFLLDPLTFPRIKGSIPRPFHPKELPKVDGFKMVQNVVSILQKKQGRLPGDHLDIPVAVALAKSDLLRFVLPHPWSRFTFMNQPAYPHGVDLKQLPLVNEEVQTVLRDNGGQNVIDESTAFAKVNYFAVSATGSALDSNQKYPVVQPLRCADPLAWLLQTLGVID